MGNKQKVIVDIEKAMMDLDEANNRVNKILAERQTSQKEKGNGHVEGKSR